MPMSEGTTVSTDTTIAAVAVTDPRWSAVANRSMPSSPYTARQSATGLTSKCQNGEGISSTRRGDTGSGPAESRAEREADPGSAVVESCAERTHDDHDDDTARKDPLTNGTKGGRMLRPR